MQVPLLRFAPVGMTKRAVLRSADKVRFVSVGITTTV